MNLNLKKEAVTEVVGGCTVAELLVEVVREEYIVSLEIPLKDYVIRHFDNSTVSSFTYNNIVYKIVECTGNLTVLVVCDNVDSCFVVASVHLYKCFFDSLDRLCYNKYQYNRTCCENNSN